MPRQPSIKTLKVLFAQSLNRCAAPGCDTPVVAKATARDDAAPLAQVAHIVARTDHGPRGDPDFPRDQLHAESNLILLCGHHHALVDAQDATFTADELRQWKRDLIDAQPDASGLLDEAEELMHSLRWEEAVSLFEQSALLATHADADIRRRAHLGAANCLLERQLGTSPAPNAELARVEDHLNGAVVAGARDAQISAIRARVAGLERVPQLVLEYCARRA